MDANARLAEAVESGDLRRVKGALARGADPSVSHGQRGRSALGLAAARGDLSVLAALIAAVPRRKLNAFDAEGFTPLMRAVEAGHVEAVQALLDAGADASAQADGAGESALRLAAANGTVEMCRRLLAAGADPLRPGRMSLTPLDRARERRTPEGRMIAALFARHLASPPAAAPAAPAAPAPARKKPARAPRRRRRSATSRR